MSAVVLTGPPGAGKTSVLTALADALSDDDVAARPEDVTARIRDAWPDRLAAKPRPASAEP